MKKELIITFVHYGMGGAQRRAINLANEFAKKGYTVYLLSVLDSNSTITKQNFYNINDRVKLIFVSEHYQNHKKDEAVVTYEKKAKTQISFLKKLQLLFKSNKKILHRINYYINCLRNCNALKSFMLFHPNSIIINFGFSIYDKVYFSSKDLNCKIIYAETNASNKYKLKEFYDLVEKKIKKADCLVFQTREEKTEHNFKKNKNAYVINNPINPNLPPPYKGSRNKTIVNFCRLSRQKNLLLLLQAFEKLHREFPEYKLEIYTYTGGPDNSEYKNELMSFICNKNLMDCVFLLPPSSDIHNIILKSAMFVSSSDYEGISNSMIEAMAIGLPCVCTDCDGGGAREMITDGENGLLVPVRDAEALKNAMVRMITEEGLSEKCSKNAAKIRETHSIEKISEKWLEVLNNL